MIVECVDNTGRLLTKEITDQATGWNKDAKFDLTVGKQYTVYALEVIYGCVWFYIEGDDYDGHKINYPIHYPVFLFKLVSGQLSKFWKFQVLNDGDNYVTQLISFPEWLNEDAYYDLLTDGNDREVKIYERYRELINKEFGPEGHAA